MKKEVWILSIILLCSIAYATNIDRCQALASNDEYFLTEDLSNASNCFTESVSTSNITFDCQGHSLTGIGTNIAFVISQEENLTIKNCIFNTWSYALSWTSINNTLVYNNTFNLSESDKGYRVYEGDNINISYNTFFANTTDTYSIYSDWTMSNATIEYNNFSDCYIALYSEKGTYDTNFTNNRIERINASIYTTAGMDNVIINSNTFYNQTDGIFFGIYSNVNWSNLNISENTFDSVFYAIYLISIPEDNHENVSIHDNIFQGTLSKSLNANIYSTDIIKFDFFNNTVFNQDISANNYIDVDNMTDSQIYSNTFGNTSDYLNGSASIGVIYANGSSFTNITDNNLYFNGSGIVVKSTDVITESVNISYNNLFQEGNETTHYGICLGEDGVGQESANHTISYNSIAMGADYSEVDHSLILGGSNDSEVLYNNISRGAYGIILKCDMNIYTEGNNAYNNTQVNFYDKGSHNAYFINNYGTQDDSGSYNIELKDACFGTLNSTFVNMQLGTLGSTRAVQIYENSSIILLNVTYDAATNESVSATDSNLTRQWYFRTLVTDSNGNGLKNVNIAITNDSGFMYSLTTDNAGNTNSDILTEYFNDKGTTTYYSPYYLTISFSGYQDYTQTINLTTNIDQIITLETEEVLTIITNSGGGGSSGSVQVKSGQTQEISINLDAPAEAIMEQDSAVSFNFGSGSHTMTVKSIDAASKAVTLEIKSTPQTVTITTGAKKQVDLDGDGSYDLEIYLKTIIGTKAYIELKALNEGFNLKQVSKDEETQEVSLVQSKLQQVKKSSLIYYVLGLILIIIIASLILISRRSKENRPKQYRPRKKRKA